MTGPRSTSSTHRTATRPEAAARPRRVPRLRTQAALALAVPALVWVATHLALVAAAVAAATGTVVAGALVRRLARRAGLTAPLAE